MSQSLLVALHDVTVRFRDSWLLHHTTWQIERGQQWVVLGPNGSGKSALVRTLSGELPTAGGARVVAPGVHLELVSFETQQALLMSELERDHARHFAGVPDQVLTARHLLQFAPAELMHKEARAFGLDALLDHPFRALSAGEMRKLLILRALLRQPDLLILDEPFDGLDAVARDGLAERIAALAVGGTQLVLVTHRAEEIPAATTHALTVRDLAVARCGERATVLDADHLRELYPAPTLTGDSITGYGVNQPLTDRPQGAPLVEFRGVTIRHGEHLLLHDFTWAVHAGEHWAIVGPNGSGKTTLVQLINGDDQHGYAIELRLFGRRKGSGESMWEVKSRLGVVTPYLQLIYSRDTTILEAVASGFFDSIGLYQRPSAVQLERSHAALAQMGISALSARLISRISYGQRRLVLIARALVKQPQLLLLDEPCQGLDPANRALVIAAVERVCGHGDSTVVYITHHEDERPPSVKRTLYLPGNGRYRQS